MAVMADSVGSFHASVTWKTHRTPIELGKTPAIDLRLGDCFALNFGRCESPSHSIVICHVARSAASLRRLLLLLQCTLVALCSWDVHFFGQYIFQARNPGRSKQTLPSKKGFPRNLALAPCADEPRACSDL
eukprot:s1050_g21.t1